MTPTQMDDNGAEPVPDDDGTGLFRGLAWGFLIEGLAALALALGMML